MVILPLQIVVVDMLKKHTGYVTSEPFLRVIADLQNFLEQHKALWKGNAIEEKQP